MKKYVSEIFLGTSYVSKEDWHKFILAITKYVGYFRSFELILNIEMNECRYFVISTKSLPSTIGDLSDFILKSSDFNLDLTYQKGMFYSSNYGETFIDIYDKFEIKKMCKLRQLRFRFKLTINDKYNSSIYGIFLNSYNKALIRNKIIFNTPEFILSVNYVSSRFFYKKKPKYLDIQKSLHLLKSDSLNSILKVDTFPYLEGDYYLNPNSYSFDKHSMIVGGSGTGKSKLMSLFINNLSLNIESKLKYKIIVIDPHAAIINDIGGLEDTKILDFKNVESSADLFTANESDIVVATESILSLIKSLLKTEYNSKMDRMIRYTVYLLLSKKDFSFINLRKVILDSTYRLELLKELANILPEPVIDFFLNDFNDLKTKSYTEAIAPIISFIDEIALLPVFSNKEKANDIKDIIKNNFITLFSLDKTKIGDKATKTIVSLTLNKIMELVEEYTFDEHIILLIDEISTVESSIVPIMLSEARKYNLSLILATQYFDQISSELKSSIFANMANYYIFRVSKIDAKLLEDNLAIKLSNNDLEEARINLLSNLGDRECIVRVNSGGLVLPAIKASTLDFVSNPKKVFKTSVASEIIVSLKEETLKRPFSIKSEITLNDIMIEQSSSRKKVS